MSIDWYYIAIENGFETPREMFEHYYLELGWSTQAISRQLKYSIWSTTQAMKKHGINLRPHGGPRYKAKNV